MTDTSRARVYTPEVQAIIDDQTANEFLLQANRAEYKRLVQVGQDLAARLSAAKENARIAAAEAKAQAEIEELQRKLAEKLAEKAALRPAEIIQFATAA